MNEYDVRKKRDEEGEEEMYNSNQGVGCSYECSSCKGCD